MSEQVVLSGLQFGLAESLVRLSTLISDFHTKMYVVGTH